MATATTSTFTLTSGKIVAQAYTLAGQAHDGTLPDADQLTFGLERLQTRLLGLQAKGLFPRLVVRIDTAVAANATEFDCPAGTLDVGEKMNLRDELSEVDQLMFRISRSDYFNRTNKTANSVPTEYYVEKADTGIKVLFVVKSDRDYTIQWQQHRQLRDIDSGDVEIDLDVRWLNPVITMVAYDLCIKVSHLAKAQLLRDQYEDEIGTAVDNETERGVTRFTANLLHGIYR